MTALLLLSPVLLAVTLAAWAHLAEKGTEELLKEDPKR